MDVDVGVGGLLELEEPGIMIEETMTGFPPPFWKGVDDDGIPALPGRLATQ